LDAIIIFPKEFQPDNGTKYDESQHIDATDGKKVEVRNCPIREIA
jgi:hypothetical protein